MAASAWRQLRSTSASAQAVTASAGVDSGPMAASSGGHRHYNDISRLHLHLKFLGGDRVVARFPELNRAVEPGLLRRRVEHDTRRGRAFDVRVHVGFVEDCHGVHTPNRPSLITDGLDGVIHQLSSVGSRVDSFLSPAADAVSHADRLRLRNDKVRVFSERLGRIVFGYVEHVRDHFRCAPLGQILILSNLSSFERNLSTGL
nr:hypothetical protein Iba_chr09aCG0650 [Ipomoea batatas]